MVTYMHDIYASIDTIKEVAVRNKAYAILVFALVSGTAAAGVQSWYHTRITYYSDATKTVVVGRETDLCTGETISTGIVTPYYRVDTGSCP